MAVRTDKAIVRRSLVAVLVQPGSKREYADGRHAVRQHRKIRLAGDEVEAGGMNENDSHGRRSRSVSGSVCRNNFRHINKGNLMMNPI